MKISFRNKGTHKTERQWPGFTKLWNQIRTVTGTKQGYPKYIVITDEVERLFISNDAYVSYRFLIELPSMNVISSTYGGISNCPNDEKVQQAIEVPIDLAIVNCVLHDFSRYFEMSVQVNTQNLAKFDVGSEEPKVLPDNINDDPEIAELERQLAEINAQLEMAQAK